MSKYKQYLEVVKVMYEKGEITLTEYASCLRRRAMEFGFQ